MNPRWVEEIHERWPRPAIQAWPLDTQEARDIRDVQDLLAEIDELRALVEQLQAALEEASVVFPQFPRAPFGFWLAVV